MKKIFVNLKRFEVAKSRGGICPDENPVAWIQGVIKESIALGLGKMDGVRVAYMLPEALLVPALAELAKVPAADAAGFALGSQGVYREDVAPGGNFGAFSANRPAAAIAGLGCAWAMNGHSEERRDKLGMIALYDPDSKTDSVKSEKAAHAVESMLAAQNLCALARGLNVLFCVGETAEQKGAGGPAEYEPRVKKVIGAQLREGLAGVKEKRGGLDVVVAYEPIWAIGPGKTPPNAEYIAFISSFIKDTCRELCCFVPDVVYGGGLKEENAKEIASVKTIDGGLVALTKFVQPIGFDVASFKRIIEAYTK